MLVVKNPSANARDIKVWVPSLGQEDPLGKEWQPIPIFLPRKFHGQRSLASYSPWGCKELDTTEQLAHTHEGHPEPYLLATLGVRGEALPFSIQGLPLFPLNYKSSLG